MTNTELQTYIRKVDERVSRLAIAVADDVEAIGRRLFIMIGVVAVWLLILTAYVVWR